MTTIHDITNTQTILDAPHKDLRRARACGMSFQFQPPPALLRLLLISFRAKGQIKWLCRVPLANASLTDCVFEVTRATTTEEINQWLKEAAAHELKGILGYEEKPLVSIDYKTDPRSSIVDALFTMVVNDTQVKLYVWYDNEWGYANRTAELMRKVGLSITE